MTTVIYGNATWYDTCIGGEHESPPPYYGGACGDCNDDSYDFAWPYLTTTGCVDHCGTNWPMACGDNNTFVGSECSYSLRKGRAADCCPCASQEGCSRVPLCNGAYVYNNSYYKPLLDLTTAFFIWLEGDLADGRVPIRLDY